MIKVAFAVAASLCLFVVACGGESSEPGTGPATSSTVETSPSSPSTPSTPSTGGSASDDSGPAPSSTSTPAPTPPGLCAPDAECNGLSECTDHCYGADCCSLSCTCQVNTTHKLECSLSC